jgi:murein DD-endopeptidase MepM/ murein hydrolase activator NlpD
MRTEARVRSVQPSALSSQASVLLLLSLLDSRRQMPTCISIRVWWLLIPCALGLLSCSTGRTPAPTAPKPTVGSHHHVRPGETLAAIGRLYGVHWQTLAQLNQLVDPHRIEVGQAIRIPSRPGTGGGTVPALAVPSRFVPERRLPWPTDGVLSSGFGMRGGRLHGGIDISGPPRTPIVAVEAGMVRFSGRGPGGYGNVVILDHSGGLMTLYAHNERNVVRQGERVRRGQTVALMGDTGRASGTHVHFEVHQHGRPVDPLHWLQ